MTRGEVQPKGGRGMLLDFGYAKRRAQRRKSNQGKRGGKEVNTGKQTNGKPRME